MLAKVLALVWALVLAMVWDVVLAPVLALVLALASLGWGLVLGLVLAEVVLAKMSPKAVAEGEGDSVVAEVTKAKEAEVATKVAKSVEKVSKETLLLDPMDQMTGQL